ncbi:MAG TPA: hypothetical protein VJU16_00385 [Planctomycetota bacterium]|nr:hypothetical protein [Planctomycetota bacterium]
MTLLLLLALLQAPDDLAGFLAGLEKDRAKGATSEDLLKKMDAWAQGKADETVARLAWNRELLKSTIRIDALFVEGLKRRVGKQVTIQRSTGVVKDVKADRVVLGVSGGSIELLFSEIAYDARLDDIKKEGLLSARSVEEAVFRFAGGKSVAALGTARGLPAGEEQERALAAIAGFVLQELDKALAAGPTVKAAEDLAAGWAKQADLVAAGGGAISKFIDKVLAPKLVEEADALIEKDRKAARKLLDLAASLCKSDDISAKVAERKWAVLDKGEWMSLPLDQLTHDGGTMKGKVIAFEDKAKEPNTVTGLKFSSLSIAWEEISGVRARVKPIKADFFDMRFRFGPPHQIESVAVSAKNGYGYRIRYEDKKEPIIGKGSTRQVAKKADYELTAQWEGKKWKFSVSGTDIDTFDMAEEPKEIAFIAAKGGGELLSLAVRKK